MTRRISPNISLATTCVLTSLLLASLASAEDIEALAAKLREFNIGILPKVIREQATKIRQEGLRNRLQWYNNSSTNDWQTIKTREDWVRYREKKMVLLEKSLGVFPTPPTKPEIHITGTIQGDGFRIDKLVFASRPGLWVTANLYRPEKPTLSMPGFVISHSHHLPKTDGELQDMGITWARAGCVVIVPDHLGHGERREHPFHKAEDFDKEYRVSRQDYFFRYDNGIQLHLVGQSLIGQLAWDMSRCVDVLLVQPGIDPKRIIMLGAVAGGGEPCAVAAALDTRIAAAAPFNFGGPQPETRGLREGTERDFNFAGGGSWESTRNMRDSAVDGFLPWVIVGGIAPRKLIYAHEFTWDRDYDPVWKRLQSIYGFFNYPEGLAFTHGSGSVKGRAPESTHCNNIGAVHRKMMHQAFQRWFEIPDQSDKEYSHRLTSDQLRCWTPELCEKLKPQSLRKVCQEIADDASKQLLVKLEQPPANEHRNLVAQRWDKTLGGLIPNQKVKVRNDYDYFVRAVDVISEGPFVHSRFYLNSPNDSPVISIHLKSAIKKDSKPASEQKTPVVFAISRHGIKEFLNRESLEIAKLLQGGVTVCIVDFPASGSASNRTGASTSGISTDLMLGEVSVGWRIKELSAIIRHCKKYDNEWAMDHYAIWSDDAVPPNPSEMNVVVPHGIDGRPKECEPLGGLLALFVPLFEPGCKASYIQGGLISYRSVLNEPAVYIPYDAMIPDALQNGDLADIAGVLAPLQIRAELMVDGTNRLVPDADVSKIWKSKNVTVSNPSKQSPAEWLLEKLK